MRVGLQRFAEAVVSAISQPRAIRLACYVGNQVCATIRMKSMVQEMQADPTKEQDKAFVEKHVAQVEATVANRIEAFKLKLQNKWKRNANGWEAASVNGKIVFRGYLDDTGVYHKKMVHGGYIMFVDAATGNSSFDDPFGCKGPMWSMEVCEGRFGDLSTAVWKPCDIGMFSSLPLLLAQAI